ncbi:hypothetical protein TBLA_0H01390 [Henningerozyma blattae CBS 6284]|uniref:Uncharacterized protein n=1 Tax=Henningerozyma blattae (strain ATCC 34711 / CBS 6284 / DSM 70876 / NBRC 10599 / NRRL Y-10934 / UCD 77-7) TaxID=1071380 RepID=I2H7S4_HENB6|nr:hypothetical protein TBLA_0H01390 [Tetrapisispora blattae CBS 6284]CCH62426.1 hypothetical protein TBLA_0H01390 [Tetrapisispora blattae CBS 6284]
MNRNIIEKVDEFEKRFLSNNGKDSRSNIDNNIYSFLKNVDSSDSNRTITTARSNNSTSTSIDNDRISNENIYYQENQEDQSEEENEEEEEGDEDEYPEDLVEQERKLSLQQKLKEAELQWEESLDQLHTVLNWVVLPLLGKMVGRRLARMVWQRVMNYLWD